MQLLSKTLRLCCCLRSTDVNGNRLNLIRKYATDLPKLPDCHFAPSHVKARSTGKVGDAGANLSPAIKHIYKEPMVLAQGHMQYVWDNFGKRYLDMFGGIVTTSVGHCHPRLVEATTKQLSKLWHASTLYPYDEIYEYSEKLCQKFPKNLNKVFLCNSGSEANDLAIFMARCFTKRFDVVALRNAYHGDSPYVMGLCGIGTWRFSVSVSFGFHHTSNPDPFLGKHGGQNCRDSPVKLKRHCDCVGDHCNACDAYLDDLQEVLDTTVPRKGVAAFIAESIQGVGGVVQFPKNYLKKAAQLVRTRGGLFIADEVQTGFGRTGSHFWGFGGHDVVPDIVTMAKGIGNGFPLAAVVTTTEIAESMTEASYFNTFGGNPLACRIGATVLDIIEEEHLQKNCKEQGTTLLETLSGLMEKYPDVIGDVRGKGLMVGVELQEKNEKKIPMSAAKVQSILEECREIGLLVGKGGPRGNVLRIKPPMCITEEDVYFACDVLEVAIKKLQK